MAQHPAAQIFTTPVGRLVQGSVSELNEKDLKGNPRMSKSDPTKPAPQCYFALAIAKNPGQHWASSEWGGKIWQVGHAGNPQAGQIGHFAWKIIDGDSTEFNQGTPPKRWNEHEGFPGHWILKISSGFLPDLYSLLDPKMPGQPSPLLKPGSNPAQKGVIGEINTGDYAQVNITCAPNGDLSKPGVYLNGNMVCLAGYGQRITSRPDVASAGFGGVPLPAGASAIPLAAPNPAAPPAAGGPSAAYGQGAPSAPMQTTPAPPGTAGYSTSPPPPGAPSAPGAPPVPNPQFLTVPGHAAPPVAAPAAPAAPQVAPPPVAGLRMTTAAQTTYEEYRKAGWSDDQLIAGGLAIR